MTLFPSDENNRFNRPEPVKQNKRWWVPNPQGLKHKLEKDKRYPMTQRVSIKVCQFYEDIAKLNGVLPGYIIDRAFKYYQDNYLD